LCGASFRAMDRRAVALAALAAVVIAVALRRRRRRSKPVLAVDYDEVCVGYVDAFARYCNEKRGTAVSRDDFHSYQFWLVEGCRLRTREEAIDCVYDFHSSKHFEQMQPIAGAYEALRQLSTKYELHVVTSRQASIEDATRAHAALLFPGVFTAIHIGNHYGKSGAKRSKPQMCADIGAVALIDDSMDYAKQCAAAGIRTFLFGAYAWNGGAVAAAASAGGTSLGPHATINLSSASGCCGGGGLEDLPQGVQRVMTWSDVVRELL